MPANFPTCPRRVVTGIKNGKSIITEDKTVTNVSELVPGLIISDIWATDSMPASLVEAPLENSLFPEVKANGTRARYVQIPPDSTIAQEKFEQALKDNKPHPLMHQTPTLDYIIILSGELWLIMDEGETLLKPGDMVIQRSTNHAWSNRSSLPCIQLAILIDAKD
jgi:mannose-6-phosphate isomerase-like protein (cupin superfamily)